jgi:hypothetical protein
MGSHGVASPTLRAGKNRQQAGGLAASPRSPRVRTLRDWPVSWRLVAVIVLALVMGLVFGGLRVASAAESAAEFGRVSQLASLGQQVTGLVQALRNERDETTGSAQAVTPARSRPGTTRQTRRPPGSGRWPPASAARSRRTSRPAWPPCCR